LASVEKNDSNDRYYQVIYNDIVQCSPMGAEWSVWMTKTVLYYSGQYRIDPLLVTALFHQESRFNMAACSRTGAIGIAQLQPETAAGMGFDATDPAQNIEGGIKYLATQLSRFSQAGEWAPTYAIAAYNAGPGAVIKYQGIPPYPETQTHVNRVAAIYKDLQQGMGY
jgi:soluble lytic murein transglycosylase-like protein